MLFIEAASGNDFADVLANAAVLRSLKPVASADLVEDISVNSGTLMPLQMCTNGTFEGPAGNVNGWSPGPNNTLQANNAVAHSGTWNLMFTRTNATAGNAYLAYVWGTLTIGARYTFEAWVYSGSGSKTVDASIGNVFYTNAVTVGDATWKKIYRTFVAAATSYTVYVRQETGAAGNTWAIDDVRMYRAPVYLSSRSTEPLGDIVQDTSALTVTNLRTALGAATLDQVDVQMQGTLTVNPGVVLQGTGDAETSTSSAALSFISDGRYSGSIDVDVAAVANRLIIGFFMTSTLDIDVNLDNTTRWIATYWSPAVVATLYLYRAEFANWTMGALLALDATNLTVSSTAGFKPLPSYTLPPPPEPAVGGDPPAAGGILIRALWGVVVDMDTPTVVDGIPK